ncbi:MAG: hypothetical protein H0T11_00525, partial [Chthoniobacterales bacterium]|nr:hypothetical protein [Chthoniobacterales bacterium]
LDGNRVIPHICLHVLAQVKTGFDGERAVKFHILRAARPGVGKLMIDLDPHRDEHQLSHLRGLLQVDAIVDGNAGLELRDLDKRVAHFTRETLEFGRALLAGPHRPGFKPQKDEGDEERYDDKNQREGERP